jgi:hypothetical protein
VGAGNLQEVVVVGTIVMAIELSLVLGLFAIYTSPYHVPAFEA